MKKVRDNLKYLTIYDVFSVFIFIILLIPSLIYRIYLKIVNKKIWLITEDGTTARDNGYYFFKYIRDNYPKDYAYYVIDKKCSDYQKVANLGNIIQFRSLKHWIYYMSASKNISNHKHGNPSQVFFNLIHVKLKLYNNRVFLQHGIIKDNLPFVYYKNARFRLFICSTDAEYNYVLNNFGYPHDYVVKTGLARFDNLHDIKINKSQILFMPTWRNWFGGNSFSKEEFKKTDYYKYWNALLNDQVLIDFIKSKGITIYFYPHQHMEKYLDCFSSIDKSIKIVNNKIMDIQDLLKTSALLVTDYSSVFMDFAYMNKPTLYYQFDKEEFREKHLQKGYFDYYEDAFGPILDNQGEVVIKIMELVNKDYELAKVYQDRINKFFLLRDRENSKRIYHEIKKLEA